MKIDEPLWTSSEIFGACGVGSARPWFADGLQTDSREVMPGDLFVALKGKEVDGHAFVRDALDRGAVAAIVSFVPDGVEDDDPRLVLVPDVTQALASMATYASLRAPVTTVAITGSAAKTSITQALRKSLERTGETHASVKSFNNHVGLPLSMARMRRSARYGVFEVGISHPGEMAERTGILAPDIAIISTIGSAHLGNFRSLGELVREKAHIFDGVKAGGTAIIGIDNPFADDLVQFAHDRGARVVTVSAETKADVMPLQLTEKYDCSCLTADVNGTMITYKVGQPGREWVLNSLLVLAAVSEMGADLGVTALALASLEAEPGRGRQHRIEDGDQQMLLIDDSYNANPLSMNAALDRLALIPQPGVGRKMAVLADMQELGREAEQAHAALAGKMRASGLYKVFALGDLTANAARTAGLAVEKFEELASLTDSVIRDLGNGDVLLVKGANSAGLDALVATILDRTDRVIEPGYSYPAVPNVAE